MECGEPLEAAEICRVQREDVTDPMNVHGCCQASIVDPNSEDFVLYHNPPPFPIDLTAVWQQTHAGLNCAYFLVGLGSGQPETITGDGPSHHVPKFCNILVRVVERCTLLC